MKECMECGKEMGILEGYRHPTMGKDSLLCSNCFDTVSESVDKWSKFILPYVDFFNKESSAIDDIQKIEDNITKNVKNIRTKLNNIWFHKTNRNTTKILSTSH